MDKLFGKVKKIHFVGIGGIGMSGIAEVLNNLGFEVTGSDVSESTNVERLRNLGITVKILHRAENASGADVVVYTSAVSEDNPEIVYARENFIPVIRRGEMLAELMRMKHSIAVSGSHGKTTTTSMISQIFNKAQLDPTVVVGGILNTMDTNAALGAGNMMIVEADESDRSFLMMQPTFAVVTNIDYEHPDTYSGIDDVKDCFEEFASKVPFYGSVAVCLDDAHAADVMSRIHKRIITYGINSQADFQAKNIEKKGFSVSFDIYRDGENKGRVNLAFPGEHNILNALAAISIAREFDIPFETIVAAFDEFSGVQRRLTERYDDGSCTVLDDYGHHPTEIKTTLKAVREAYGDRRIVVVFQPHRYTRTEALFKEFTTCFFDADILMVTDVYAASEKPIEGVNSQSLVSGIKAHGFKNAHYIPDFDSVLSKLKELKCESSVFITLGAGSITRFSYELAGLVKELKGEG